VPNAELLAHICDFLQTWLHQACTDHVAIDLFAGELRQQWAAMREGANETPPNSWVIPCPADIDTADGIATCGKSYMDVRQALQYLGIDETEAKRLGIRVFKVGMTWPLEPSQFDALVSFHYNTGAIGRATLTKRHLAGDYAGAAREFARWNRAAGQVLKGLTRRRAAEAELYLSE
jgi:hypothetical protein